MRLIHGKSKKSRNNSIVVQSAILASAQILVRVIGLFVPRVPMQRIIGDEGNGFYGLASTIYQFILLCRNGIPTAVALLTARHLARREYKKRFSVFLKGPLSLP